MQNTPKKIEEFEPDLQELIKKFILSISNHESTYFDTEEIENIIFCFIDMDNMAMARKALEYAYLMYPNEERWKCHEAEILVCEDHYKKALNILNTLSEDFDANIPGMKGECYARLRRYKSAKESFDRYLTVCHPDELENAFLDIIIIFNEEKQAKIAMNYIENALTLFPDNYEIRMEKALSLEALEKYDEAIAEYNRLIDANPYECKAWGMLGSLYFILDRYGEAEKCYDYVLAINPDDYEAKTQKAHCRYKSGDYVNAITFYKEALTKYPDDILLKLYLAESYNNLDVWSEALPLYKQVTAVLPYMFAEAWIGMAGCVINMDNDFEGAVKILTKGMKNIPDDLTIKFHLAHAEMDLYNATNNEKEIKRALKHIKECLQEVPTHPLFHYEAAHIYLQISKFEEAVHHFELALESDIDFPNIYIFLAVACYGMDDTIKFKKYYAEAKKRYSNTEEMLLSIFPKAKELIKTIGKA